jgi:hypothetical protein
MRPAACSPPARPAPAPRGRPVGVEVAPTPPGQRLEQVGDGDLGNERSGCLEAVEASVVRGARRRPHVLDVDAVDLADLCDEERHQIVARQFHNELVDGATSAAFENVDANQVAADRTDPAGDGAEGAGTIGHPDPHDKRRHDPKP